MILIYGHHDISAPSYALVMHGVGKSGLQITTVHRKRKKEYKVSWFLFKLHLAMKFFWGLERG